MGENAKPDVEAFQKVQQHTYVLAYMINYAVTTHLWPHMHESTHIDLRFG